MKDKSQNIGNVLLALSIMVAVVFGVVECYSSMAEKAISIDVSLKELRYRELRVNEKVKNYILSEFVFFNKGTTPVFLSNFKLILTFKGEDYVFHCTSKKDHIDLLDICKTDVEEVPINIDSPYSTCLVFESYLPFFRTRLLGLSEISSELSFIDNFGEEYFFDFDDVLLKFGNGRSD